MSVAQPSRTAAPAAILAGAASAFVAGIGAVALIRPGLLADPEPSWAPYRLLLMLSVALAAAGAGSAAAALLYLSSRTLTICAPLEAWPPGAPATLALAALALAAGVFLRFVALGRVPEWLWIDDLSLIQPALALQGRFADFFQLPGGGLALLESIAAQVLDQAFDFLRVRGGLLGCKGNEW